MNFSYQNTTSVSNSRKHHLGGPRLGLPPGSSGSWQHSIFRNFANLSIGVVPDTLSARSVDTFHVVTVGNFKVYSEWYRAKGYSPGNLSNSKYIKVWPVIEKFRGVCRRSSGQRERGEMGFCMCVQCMVRSVYRDSFWRLLSGLGQTVSRWDRLGHFDGQLMPLVRRWWRIFNNSTVGELYSILCE